ncbi:Leucine carboxyl methyltransferase 1 [Hyphodiscus hymeniophilus]|uniref:Leucine carboxyl methyltransferase 1 n=1 Tax=Hyphodiscus hymeniophilus TaxID=353542 RepID=A0A9P7AX00_9HELO|nr:Leucine carboxyl methyltransferase 1 [Hyphodiscus hymeniophilus]
MSSSQIPNLLSSRGGPRSRGRGRGRGGSTQLSAASRRDLSIQATDTDAAVSRLSAVSMGYLDDPFAPFFVNGQGTRRLPIINRGTYARTNALDILIDAFLSPSSQEPELKQIVSLGAGTDTRYFRLRAQNRHHNVIYHEFDFPAVCAAKCHIVESNKSLSRDETIARAETVAPINTGSPGIAEAEWQLLRSVKDRSGGMEAGYICHPLDLRELPSIPGLSSFRGLKADLPTLIISECCLCYLEVDVAKDVLKWFTDRIPSIGVILYEPIGVDDAFGQMMVENLATRGIVMPTVQRYKALEDQLGRLKELGFGGDGGSTNAITIENIWEEWITTEERERVDGLEGLDEVEEWQMLARHYAVVWGERGSYGWETWRNLQQQTNPR